MKKGDWRALRCVALRVRGEATTSDARNARVRKKKEEKKKLTTRGPRLPVIFPAFVACLS
jgi:hypothetical protein